MGSWVHTGVLDGLVEGVEVDVAGWGGGTVGVETGGTVDVERGGAAALAPWHTSRWVSISFFLIIVLPH